MEVASSIGATPSSLPPYRERRSALMTGFIDLFFPAIVVALGLFFSISTLILTFQPSDE